MVKYGSSTLMRPRALPARALAARHCAARQTVALGAEADDNLAGNVRHGFLGAVTAESERRFQHGGQTLERRNRYLMQKFDGRFRTAVRDERKARAGRRHSDLAHRDRLKVAAVLAGRRKSCSFEAGGHVIRRTLVRRGSGIAAFHAVVRERLGRVPPRKSVRVMNLTVARVLLRLCRGCRCQREAQGAGRPMPDNLEVGPHGATWERSPRRCRRRIPSTRSRPRRTLHLGLIGRR